MSTDDKCLRREAYHAAMTRAANNFKLQLLETLATLVTAAFGLVAALAWNETIKEVISLIFPSGDGTIWGNLTYAIIVTVLAVIVTLVIARAIAKLKKANAEL